jgi:hypothetical protein
MKPVFIALLISLVLRFVCFPFFEETSVSAYKIVLAIIIIGVGAAFVLKKSADVVEETTDILSKRTKIAGGLLQSFGTAFPDMVLGIIAATISLQLRNSDWEKSVNYAVLASATTFGSNIYNVGFAIWAIYRQNIANFRNKSVAMFPFIKKGDKLTPFTTHKNKPVKKEIEVAISLLTYLSGLTALVAMSMVFFGKIESVGSDALYQLTWPFGLVILCLALLLIYSFRERKGEKVVHTESIENQEATFSKYSTLSILGVLILAGIAILFTAESMVKTIEILCSMYNIPIIIAGVLTAIIGCLGEMIVVYNFSVNPKGRIGDAIVGVAMDNVVTIIGASVVAILGGIFLGGSALIIIFVLVLLLNSILVWQITYLERSLN